MGWEPEYDKLMAIDTVNFEFGASVISYDLYGNTIPVLYFQSSHSCTVLDVDDPYYYHWKYEVPDSVDEKSIKKALKDVSNISSEEFIQLFQEIYYLSNLDYQEGHNPTEVVNHLKSYYEFVAKTKEDTLAVYQKIDLVFKEIGEKESANKRRLFYYPDHVALITLEVPIENPLDFRMDIVNLTELFEDIP